VRDEKIFQRSLTYGVMLEEFVHPGISDRDFGELGRFLFAMAITDLVVVGVGLIRRNKSPDIPNKLAVNGFGLVVRKVIPDHRLRDVAFLDQNLSREFWEVRDGLVRDLAFLQGFLLVRHNCLEKR